MTVPLTDIAKVAFDVIGEITISKRFGFLDAGADPDNVLGEIERELSYRAVVGFCPEIIEHQQLTSAGRKHALDPLTAQGQPSIHKACLPNNKIHGQGRRSHQI